MAATVVYGWPAVKPRCNTCGAKCKRSEPLLADGIYIVCSKACVEKFEATSKAGV